MNEARILVAGIGNIFMGDDAFGSEVARRLLGKLPQEVRVLDFGIRGIDLAYALMDGYDAFVLIDATARGGEPGTLYTIEPDLNSPAKEETRGDLLDAHGMDPVKVLRFVKSMGVQPNQVFIVGCEPATTSFDEGGEMRLSDPVERSVGEAMKIVASLVSEILGTLEPGLAVGM